MPKIFVKPSHPDLIVKDTATRKVLAADGEEVEESSFWLRRITDGDVVVVKPPKAQPAAKAAAKVEDK